MLQTAKMFARRGSSLEPNVSGNSKRVNGLTFGEFCVLAADLKRFRTTQQQHQQLLHQQHPPPHQQPPHHHNNDGLAADDATATASSSASPAASSSSNGDNGSAAKPPRTTTSTIPEDNALAASLPNGSASAAIATAPEVFLGGSCNPTTWRADVAIPALDKLGISFYNPVRTRNLCHIRTFATINAYFLVSIDAASLRLDARPHRAGAPRQGEGTRPVLRHGLGDARVGRRDRSGAHCRPECSPFGRRAASVPGESVHFE